jgi:hypothetical protein
MNKAKLAKFIVGETPNPALLSKAVKEGGEILEMPLYQRIIPGSTYWYMSLRGIVPKVQHPIKNTKRIILQK